MKKYEKYIRALKKINSDNLISLTGFQRKNLLIVLKEIDLSILFKNSKLMKTMEKSGITPLFLTEIHIRTSMDVFPLEYLGMKDDPKVLYGSDILSEINVPEENLRLQSEQKIKGALILLTQVILEEGPRKKALVHASLQAIEDICQGLTGLMYLKEKNILTGKDLLDKCASSFSIDLSVLGKIQAWTKKTPGNSYAETLHEYYEIIEKLAGIADKMDQKA